MGRLIFWLKELAMWGAPNPAGRGAGRGLGPGLLPLARPRPAAGRQAAPGALARAEGAGPRAKLRYLRAVEAYPSARDRAIALLPLYTGTRIAEITALDVADVRLSARKGEIHHVGKVRKPGRSRCTRSSARRWPPGLRSVPHAAVPARPPCSPRSRASRMTTDAIADVLTAITRAAGLDDHVTSHVLRHTFGPYQFPPRRRPGDRGRADGPRLAGDHAALHPPKRGGHAAGGRPADRGPV